MAGGLKWHGDKIQAQYKARLRRALSAAAILVAATAKKLVNVEGTGRDEGKRDSKGRFKKALKYGANPSEPGEPPHKQTGHLLRSITWEVEETTARVGTNLPYGRHLEEGTRHMAARPWLNRSLNACRAPIVALLKSMLN